MSVEESDRSALLRAAAQSWGEEAAATLSELLPPSGDRPATGRDIDGVLSAMNAMDARLTGELQALRASTDARFEAVDERFRAMDARFDTMDARFAAIDARFDGLDERFVAIDARFDAMGAELATFGERLEGYGHGIDAKLDAVVDRITASFERRISDAVTTQTRTLVFSQLGLMVLIAALAFGLR